MGTLRQILRDWRTPQSAVWLSVLPPVGAFAELAILIGAIHFADQIIPGLDVLSLEPSPYWLPVLLLSLQYGTVAGLMAAGAATFAFVMHGLPEQLIDENHFSYLLRVWALPILWIAVALILGQFRLRQIEVKEQLTARLDQSTREAEALAIYARDLERRCRQLERQVTSRPVAQGAGVLDAIAALSAPSCDLPHAFRSLCEAAFPGAALSLYALNASGLEPLVATDATKAHRIETTHGLFKAAIGERRALSVLDAAGEAVLAGEALAVVPVIQLPPNATVAGGGESGRVLGVLKLDAADGAVLSAGLTDRLTIVARMLAPMLGEPRVVVDNTERENASLRLTKGWRQFPWKVEQDEDSRGAPRPRAKT
ncbi:MAG: hypothetical protein KDJ17_05115 [Hyphomicrobiaceae bacterium]|nr:hypothetical protein [Hyphomicrobiaceae bacterium]